MKLFSTILCLLFLATLLSAQTGTLIILNKSDNTATLLDVKTKATLATIPTGGSPHEVGVSPDGKMAIVCNYGAQTPGNTLTVIDVAGKKKLKDIDLGNYQRPHGIAWLKDNHHVAVTSEARQSLLLVEVNSGAVVQAIPTDSIASHMVALTPDNARAFVANIQSGSITAIDLKELKWSKNLSTGSGAEGIDISPDGKEVWVTNRAANTVAIVDAKSVEVTATLDSKSFPIRVKLTPDGKYALVSNARSGEVAVFDTATRKEVRRIKMELSAVNDSDRRLFGNQFGTSPVPIGILILPDGKFAFVANSNADMVTLIDLKDWKIVDRIKTGKEPDGLGYSKLVLSQ